MNIAGMDLNLLLVFDAVISERNVTRAGRKIGMSQPAVSNALNRLRYFLKDDLFIRSPEGMRPTPRASELELPIRSALANIQNALNPSTFNPGTSSRAFRIAGNDYISTVILPRLAEFISKEAPGIHVHTLTVTDRLYEMLDAQEADYGILPVMGELPDRFGSGLLIKDNFVCLMSPNHPLAKYDVLPIEEYSQARHLLVSPRGDAHGVVDELLAERGLNRQIIMTVNHFGSVPLIVAESDLIVTVPERIADHYKPLADLHRTTAPVSPTPGYCSGLSLIWHNRLTNHPAHIWFRDTLLHLSADQRDTHIGHMPATDVS